MRKLALVDDHVLVRKGICLLINDFAGYTVLFEADNGRHFIEQLDPLNLPEIVLLDLSMPVMNGFETARWINQNHPDIKILVLSMLYDEKSVIQLLKTGVSGYILKDIRQVELKKALDEVHAKGIYFNELLHANFVHSLKNGVAEPQHEYEKILAIPEREKEFLKWLCTEKSLKEIAAEMHLSPRTIDGYRDNLFERINVCSRVGLVLFALRNGLVKL